MQKDDSKIDIVSITGHELRTLISGNKWALKMLLDKDLGEINSEQEQLIKKSYEKNEKMLELINQLLLLKESEDKVENKNEKILIPDEIEKIIDDYRSEAYKREIEIIFLNPDKESKKHMEINFNKKVFKIILQNLLSNALKYNKKNGSIFVSIIVIDNGVKVAVRDTGIGIPKADQQNIFNKFYRASNATKTSENGSGLGLYITNRIIVENGGIMEMESEEGVGSTFTFSIFNQN